MDDKIKKNLCTGNDLIDEEHKVLLGKIEQLSQAIKEGLGEGAIMPLISFLSEYSVKHFEFEERLMKEKGYPDFAAHVEKHSEFSSAIEDIEKDYRSDGPSPQLVLAVNNLLMNWFQNHIKEHDTAFTEFLNSSNS